MWPFTPDPNAAILSRHGGRSKLHRLGRRWWGWWVHMYRIEQSDGLKLKYPALPKELQEQLREAAIAYTARRSNQLVILEGPPGKEAYYHAGRCLRGPGRIIF